MYYLIIATICFSLSFGLIKTQLTTLPSEFVVFTRLFLASLLFIPFIKRTNLKTCMLALLIGAVQFGIMYLCFINAFHFLQANEIALLTTTTPVFVAIWATLCGEKFKKIYLLCILLSVIGAGIIVWKNITFDMLFKGILLMELSNCSFALGQVLWKKYIGKEKSYLIAYAYLGATILVLPLVFFKTNINNLNLTIYQILSILYLAFIPTGIGFFLWNKGSTLVSYTTLSIMNNLKIPLGVLFSILIFKEKINFVNFSIGLFVIIVAIIILHNVLKGENKKSTF